MTTIEFQYKLVDLQASLLRFAYSLTTDKDDAKDLVQETFLKALKNRDKFADATNFKAWIFTIMKNTYINDYRRSFIQSTYFEQTNNSFLINQTRSDGIYDPDSVYISKELEKTIDTLDDNLKLPFKMRHEGFKYKEIAKTLEMNIGTVKSRIFLARKKLKDQLNGDAISGRDMTTSDLPELHIS